MMNNLTQVRLEPATPLSAGRRRSARIRHKMIHGSIVIAAIALVAAVGVAIQQSLMARGISFSFDYLSRPSQFNMSEGFATAWQGWWPVFTEVTSASTNLQMLTAGLFNTIKVAILAVIFSTLVGVVFGVARLSTNWLIRQCAFIVVEFVRNTPLLIQVVFWYFAFFLQLAPVTDAANVESWFVFGQSGLFLPLPQISGGFVALALVLAAIAFLLAACSSRLSSNLRWSMLAAGILAATTSYAAGFRIELALPIVGRFGATGGIQLSAEMSAILTAIIVNSTAYIAEIVRGAIEGLPKGQWEAAASVGLSRRDTIRDVILPQVFRIILPSLANRYISLTKDTSLGIAIGFPDLFNVSGTVANQSGHSLETVVIVMAVYLLLSWIISALISYANARATLEGSR
ncbi:general L-amino acid transport system permease protein [Rhizobium sp. BK226]|uniref:ABC transporter permease subunit n=1 Tax=Rhizobium sp. BK226 TaxID=2587075 RepID=UPI0017C0C3E0|nr:ABC transporter permease subunit [Rhizobium sp. BK226]MBB4116516.1 general L-amino acid transport system permease protein [Rhizobium sp. BK226]